MAFDSDANFRRASPLGPDGRTDDERELEWRRIDRAIENVRRSVVPLYRPFGQRVPRHGGCAVITNIGDHVFLLTASHVHIGFDGEPTAGIVAAIDGKFVPLTGRVFRTNGGPLDAAVFELAANDDSASLRELAIDLAHYHPSAAIEGEEYVLFGYPHRDAERTEGRTVAPLSYWWHGVAAPSERYTALGLRSDFHLAIEMDLDRIVDERGVIRKSPSPAGTSGSALWRLTREGVADLAGIFVEASGGHFIGTHATAHVALVAQYNPAAYSLLMSCQ